jgi:hypothetical protein
MLLGYEFRMCVKLSKVRDAQESIDQAYRTIDNGCGKRYGKGNKTRVSSTNTSLTLRFLIIRSAPIKDI